VTQRLVVVDAPPDLRQRGAEMARVEALREEKLALEGRIVALKEQVKRDPSLARSVREEREGLKTRIWAIQMELRRSPETAARKARKKAWPEHFIRAAEDYLDAETFALLREMASELAAEEGDGAT